MNIQHHIFIKTRQHYLVGIKLQHIISFQMSITILKSCINNYLLTGINLGFIQKRFFTRGTLRSIRISRLAKIPTLYHDWLRYLN